MASLTPSQRSLEPASALVIALFMHFPPSGSFVMSLLSSSGGMLLQSATVSGSFADFFGAAACVGASDGKPMSSEAVGAGGIAALPLDVGGCGGGPAFPHATKAPAERVRPRRTLLTVAQA